MNTHADRTRENKRQSLINGVSQSQKDNASTFQFVDNRPETVVQRKLQEMANDSPKMKQLKAVQEMANGSSQSKQVVQLFWQKNPQGGKPIWVNGGIPDGWVPTGQKKGGQDVYQAPEVAAAASASSKAALDQEVRVRSHAPTRRRNFTQDERARLQSIPKVVTRSDDDLFEKNRGYGQQGKKAHLTPKGLHPAGKAPINASEQMDQYSVRKGRGNRISSKAPTVGKDRSQDYGKKQVGIKAQKLERARLRGKEDAQHVRTSATSDIVRDLSGHEDEQRLKAFARKDREFHHSVSFRSSDDTDNFIPNRFLVRPDMDEIHDSDSDSDSDSEYDDDDEQALKEEEID